MNSELEVENKFLRDKIEELQSKLREIKLICDSLSKLVSKENQMDWMFRRHEMALRRIKREYKRQNAATDEIIICNCSASACNCKQNGEDEVDG